MKIVIALIVAAVIVGFLGYTAPRHSLLVP
jgi:hypothetical protein